MFAFQLLLLAAPAQAAELHTCSATLTAEGTSTTLSGYGDSEAQARRNARQAARLLADQRLVV
jgi:hypothetical protein